MTKEIELKANGNIKIGLWNLVQIIILIVGLTTFFFGLKGAIASNSEKITALTTQVQELKENVGRLDDRVYESTHSKP